MPSSKSATALPLSVSSLTDPFLAVKTLPPALSRADFGTVSTFKAATRYTVDRWLGVRGSYSTGFRAPDLAQFYYSNLTTAFQNGTGVDVLTAANSSAAARALGIPRLTPERSSSYTAGLTSQLIPDLKISVDGYSVTVNNRVGLTGSFVSTDANLPADVKNAFAATGANQAQFFFNAFDTRTTGVEFTASYKLRTGNYRDLSLIAGGNFMDTKVLDVHLPGKLNVTYLNTVLSPAERNRIEKQTPRHKINLQAVYRIDKLSFMVRPVYFGEVTSASALSANNYFYQEYPAIWVTDVSVGYRFSSMFRITAGLENAFNEVGNYTDASIAGFRTPGPGGLQNGATGRQYFISFNAQFLKLKGMKTMLKLNDYKTSSIHITTLLYACVALLNACNKTSHLDVEAANRPPLTARISFVNARPVNQAINFYTYTNQVTLSPVLMNKATPYMDVQFGLVQINIAASGSTS